MALTDYVFLEHDEDLYYTKELYVVPLEDFQHVCIYKDYDSKISLLTLENGKIKKTAIENLELQMYLANFGVEWQMVLNRLQNQYSKSKVSMIPTLIDSKSVEKHIRAFNYSFADKNTFFRVFRYHSFKSNKKDLCSLIDGVAKQKKLEQNGLVWKK